MPAREAPSESRRRQRRAASRCPPCRAAPPDGGRCTAAPPHGRAVQRHAVQCRRLPDFKFRPPRARRRRAGRGERRNHTASRRRANSRAQCGPPAQSPLGGAASIVKPVARLSVGSAAARRRSRRAAVVAAWGGGGQGGNGGLAVGQVVERLPRVAHRVKACPAHQPPRFDCGVARASEVASGTGGAAPVGAD